MKNKKIIALISSICIAVGSASFIGSAEEYGGNKLDMTGWTASAISSYDGYWSQDRLLDGKVSADTTYTNRWSLGREQTVGDWIIIDAKNAKTFNRVIQTTPAFDNGYAGSFAISVSDDGENWKKVTEGVGVPDDTVSEFTTVTARYIKIELTENNASWWNVHDISVWYDESIKEKKIILQSYGDNIRDTSKISLLFHIGVFDGSEFDGSARVTRGEFALSCARMCNLKFAEIGMPKSGFIDVAEFSVYYDAINFLAANGIVSKAEKFYPNEYISFNEAATMLVRALNYGVLAEINGGWPNGYILQAAGIGVLDGVNTSGEANKEELAYMLYNALHITSMEYDEISDKAYSLSRKKGNTFLEKNDIYYKKGILDATDKTSLYKYDGAGKEAVSVDGIKYYYDIQGINDLFGYMTRIYYYVEDDRNIILYAACDKNNVDASFTTDECSGISGNEYRWFEGDKTKKMRLSERVTMIYNGKFDLNISEDRLIPLNGTVKLISNDGDDVCDVIIVNDYINYFVDRKGTKMLSDKYGKPVLSLESAGDKLEVYKEGEKVRFADITAGTVASVLSDDIEIVNGVRTISDNAENVSIYLSKDTAEGTIVGFDENGGVETVILADGTKYSISPDFTGNTSTLKIGTTAKLYLDIFGKISGFSMSADEVYYGVLRDVALESGIGDTLEVKIFTQRGKDEVMKVAEKVKNGSTNADRTGIYNLLRSYLDTQESVVSAKVVMYKKNDAGEISMICIPETGGSVIRTESPENESKLYEDGVRNSYLFMIPTNKLGDYAHIAGSSVMFIAYYDSATGELINGEEGYKIANIGDFENAEYNDVSFYNLNENSDAGLIIMYKSGRSDIPSEMDPYMVITGTGYALDSEEVSARYIEGYVSKNKVQYFLTDDLASTEFNVGDVLRIRRNTQGKVYVMLKVVDSTVGKDDMLASNIGSDDHIWYGTGKVSRVTDNTLWLDVSRTSRDLSYDESRLRVIRGYAGGNIYMVKDGKVTIASANDIVKGDIITMKTNWTSTTDIIIFR